jgi:hypothetical protein
MWSATLWVVEKRFGERRVSGTPSFYWLQYLHWDLIALKESATQMDVEQSRTSHLEVNQCLHIRTGESGGREIAT